MASDDQAANGRHLLGGVRAMSFTVDDLNTLERFLWGLRVVPLIEAAEGDDYDIALRHDVDHSIEKAMRFATWEHNRGIRSTYFLLHTAPYWQDWRSLVRVAHMMELMGHEVGIHHDALGEVVREYGADADAPDELACGILVEAIGRLRSEGLTIRGAAAHGSGSADNVEFMRRVTPERFDLAYEAYLLKRETSDYISDNRGRWRSPLVHTPGRPAQVLVHPIHWPV